ncbi:hypothetical protein ACX1H8_20500 [Yersinia enterocolitica]|uniref:Uncharacterized protein n=1 Tax=Yersinia enterocolitica TaxID=630 RepID=A0A9P1PXD0_YEREN|nr:hypothetical protein [Yersinia enterocolitica]EKN4025329.1 hypothetical protein [Yersinia enterocolitica]EKN4800897.1 hypothetical protein [Yersinia enterocolitica]EKN4845775.1 hypothetical protein [Yersinia enterocolitica]EKN5117603.1 hypothetical protein [Yersinia enterocolitica]EKN6179365.1 hypothetical protein [Yersinia enterocolitica]
MSLDITIKVKGITNVDADRYGMIEMELSDAELIEAVSKSEIVSEYGANDLLEEIGETDVISWLGDQGYTVTETE